MQDQDVYWLVQRDKDGRFLDGTDWVETDPGFGFRDADTALAAGRAEIIRGRLRVGNWQVVARRGGKEA